MKYPLTGLALLALSSSVAAVDFDVEIENLTRGTFFTPLLVAAHPDNTTPVFTSGTQASAALQMMAEGGDISALQSALEADGATISANPASGLLAPGASATATLNTDSAAANTELSVVGMILPTNDAFMSINSLTIPTAAGTYTFFANAYDAGTEGNDEIRGGGAPGAAGFPVPPPLDPLVGTGGTGTGAQAEGFVHIHRGVLGDTDATAGNSDISATRHRWLNPVAKVTITVR